MVKTFQGNPLKDFTGFDADFCNSIADNKTATFLIVDEPRDMTGIDRSVGRFLEEGYRRARECDTGIVIFENVNKS